MIHVIGIEDNLYLLQTYHQNFCQTAFTRKQSFPGVLVLPVSKLHTGTKTPQWYQNSILVPKLHSGTKNPYLYQNYTVVPKLHTRYLSEEMRVNKWKKNSSIIQFIVCSRIERKKYIPQYNLYGLYDHKLSLVEKIVCSKKYELVWCCLGPLMIWH